MNGSCACGAVKFKTPTEKPSMLFHCHCIDCRKQSASAFGTSAIFPYFSVANDPAVTYYVKEADSGRKKYCYFCKECGSRIIHATIIEDGDPPNVSVKAGLLEGLDWSGGMHIYCRSAVVPIPGGVRRWEAEPDLKR